MLRLMAVLAVTFSAFSHADYFFEGKAREENGSVVLTFWSHIDFDAAYVNLGEKWEKAPIVKTIREKSNVFSFEFTIPESRGKISICGIHQDFQAFDDLHFGENLEAIFENARTVTKKEMVTAEEQTRKEVVDHLNALRKKEGLAPMVYSPELSDVIGDMDAAYVAWKKVGGFRAAETVSAIQDGEAVAKLLAPHLQVIGDKARSGVIFIALRQRKNGSWVVVLAKLADPRSEKAPRRR